MLTQQEQDEVLEFAHRLCRLKTLMATRVLKGTIDRRVASQSVKNLENEFKDFLKEIG